MNSDMGKKMYISDETLGVGRVARNVEDLLVSDCPAAEIVPEATI